MEREKKGGFGRSECILYDWNEKVTMRYLLSVYCMHHVCTAILVCTFHVFV